MTKSEKQNKRNLTGKVLLKHSWRAVDPRGGCDSLIYNQTQRYHTRHACEWKHKLLRGLVRAEECVHTTSLSFGVVYRVLYVSSCFEDIRVVLLLKFPVSTRGFFVRGLRAPSTIHEYSLILKYRIFSCHCSHVKKLPS